MVLERYSQEEFHVPEHLTEDALAMARCPYGLVKEHEQTIALNPNQQPLDGGVEQQPEQQPEQQSGWVDTPQATPHTWYGLHEAEEPSEDWSWWYQERGILE